MRSLLVVALGWTSCLAVAEEDHAAAEAAKSAEILRQAVPAPTAPLGYLFNLDAPPTLSWKDAALVEAFGAPAIEEVAWFDDEGQRFDRPEHGGRWIAVVRSRLPDSRPVMRGVTLFARPEGFFLVPLPSLGVTVETLPKDEAGALAAHGDEVRRMIERPLLEMINGGDPRSAILAAALDDAGKRDGAERLRYGIEDRARFCELQARLAHLGRETRPLPAIGKIDASEERAPVLRPAAVPLVPEAATELDRICQSWADESGAAFVSLAAQKGEILHHQAFTPEGGEAIDVDFRADVFSITKSISGMLAARFLDAGRFALDDPVSTVLPEFADHPEHVPTFRQCLRHQSGLQGHGSWGGVGNAWFDHLVLNGIETLHPGPRKYAGDGFDLVGSAMQLLTGETVTRLFHRSYLEPLGLPPMPFDQMGAGARPTAFELAVLGQILANRGRYGELEFFSEATFEDLLPTAYAEIKDPDPDNKEHFYGLGIRWVREHVDEKGELLFSRRTLGHGSFSHSVFLIDLERGLVIAQVREKSTKADATWYPQFLRQVSLVAGAR